MATFLGIDAGGTRSRWVLCDDSAVLIARGEGPDVQPATAGVDAAVEALRGLWSDIVEQADPEAIAALRGAVAGIAGVADAATAACLVEAIGTPLQIVGDTVIAAATGLLDGPGVALQAGTGSFAVARAADGALHRSGGLGWLCDDGGSGVDLTLCAARWIVAAADGRHSLAPGQWPAHSVTVDSILHSPLTARLLAHFGLATARAARLGAALQRVPPRAIAGGAEPVLNAAADGDAFGLQVAARGAAALSDLVVRAVSAARLDRADLRLSVGGGLLLGSERYRVLVADALRAAGLQVGALVPNEDTGLGAARLAMAVAERRQPFAAWAVG